MTRRSDAVERRPIVGSSAARALRRAFAVGAAFALGSCGALELDDLSCVTNGDCALGTSCVGGVCLTSASSGTPSELRDELILAIGNAGATECNLQVSCGFAVDTSICRTDVAGIVSFLDLNAGSSAAELICLSAYVDSRECIASMSCQQYRNLGTSGDTGPCASIVSEEVAACTGLGWYSTN